MPSSRQEKTPEHREGQKRRLERALRQQHREAHGPTCECRAFEVEQVIAEQRSRR